MAKDYVEHVGGAYRVAGSRVSLDSVVYAYLRGESPDGIAESFPALNLEQVHGAIAFYLGNRDLIDTYLRAGKADFARLQEQARRDHPSLYAKIEAAREGLSSHADEATFSSRRRLQPEDCGWHTPARRLHKPQVAVEYMNALKEFLGEDSLPDLLHICSISLRDIW